MCTLALGQEYSTAESLCKSQSVRVCACVCVYASPPPTTYTFFWHFALCNYLHNPITHISAHTREAAVAAAATAAASTLVVRIFIPTHASSRSHSATRRACAQRGYVCRAPSAFADARISRHARTHARTIAVLARFWHARSYVEQPTTTRMLCGARQIHVHTYTKIH